MHQVPGAPDYFVGRLPISKTGNIRDPPPGKFNCNFTQQQLGLVQVTDWGSLSFKFVKTLLWPNARDDRFPKTPIQNGKFVLDSTYDPTVALLNGELWVSYECCGKGMATSSCISPLTGATGDWSLDLARTTIVVVATDYNKAASVPKIFSFLGKSYMWFDYFKTDQGYIEARGIEIQKDSSGRYWAAGHSDSMNMDDPAGVTVWQPSGQDGSIADIFGVAPTPDGKHLIVSAGIGGAGCSAPSSKSNGCYRMAVGRTNFPLGKNLAHEVMLDGSTLPGNALEYAKLIEIQNGGPTVMAAHYLPPDSYHATSYSIPGGFEGVVLPKDTDFEKGFWGISSPCSNSQPYPDWGDRAMKCLPSCGGLGGTSSFNEPCAEHGKQDKGLAYDAPYCCV